jgi:hypothetical protein
MKKVQITILVFMAFSLKSISQNLAPNYSFENIIKCVQHDGEFDGYVANWIGGGGGSGPIYFTSQCPNDSTVSVPSNECGYQYAHTGKSYAGIYTFLRGLPNNRDYIQDSLINKLVSGVKYYVTFYLSLADNYKYACNSIGAYLSDSSLNYSGVIKAKSYLNPQVTNDTLHNLLTDTVKWMKVSGSFVAKGGEQYIVIGNFKDDAHSDTVFVNSYRGDTALDWNEAYYYVDDVIVTTDSNYADSLFDGVSELKVESEKVKVWPNPSDGKFTIESSVNSRQTSVEIYNVLGERIYNEPLRQAQGDHKIDISANPAGIYFYQVISEKGELIGSGKLIKE